MEVKDLTYYGIHICVDMNFKQIIVERDIKFAQEKYRINLFRTKVYKLKQKVVKNDSMYTDPANLFIFLLGFFVLLVLKS